MHVIISIIAGITALTSASGAHNDAATDMVSAARSELARAAQSRYPDVHEWSIEPLRQSSGDSSGALPANAEMIVTKFGARSAVRISWAQAGAPRHSQTMWFEVVGTQPVVVARRDLKDTEALSRADALIEDRDVLAAQCSIIASASDLDAMRVKRPLRAGAVVCRENIEPRPLVVRGDECTVRFESQRVSLLSKGVAQQDGDLGVRLRLVNPHSKESFMAVVSAAREVVVYE